MELTGKEFRDDMISIMKDEIVEFDLKPCLIITKIGNDSASDIYVNNKVKLAKEIGIETVHIEMNEEVSTGEVKVKILSKIMKMKKLGYQVASMIQMPVPNHINIDNILENKLIRETDVEGVTTEAMGKLMNSDSNDDLILPSTAIGVVDLLKYYNIPIESKNVLIIGRSNIVGNPLSQIMLNENATVTIAHSRTPISQLSKLGKLADIVVVSTGKPNFINSQVVSNNTTIIDVGINRVKGNLVGDVDIDDILKIRSGINYTPVPGGVGVVTVTELMMMTIKLAKINKG